MPQAELETVHLPILDWVVSVWGEQDGRFVVFLAGPPAAGKSTIAAVWAELLTERHPEVNALVLPMDGFHFPNSYLEAQTAVIDGTAVPLRKIKGSPETFDLRALQESVAALRRGDSLSWPIYDRRIHDPVPNALSVPDRGIFIVEGNYLLLDEPGWRCLKQYAHFTVFIEVTEETARERLLKRYARGGRNPDDALAHFAFSDRRNLLRIMSRRLSSDVTLEVRPDGSLATK